MFSILFASRDTTVQVNAFVGALKLFKIGWSWGGVTNLAMAFPSLDRVDKKESGGIVRLNIGLEDHADLIEELSGAFATLDPVDRAASTGGSAAE